jgi:hypothetical protein
MCTGDDHIGVCDAKLALKDADSRTNEERETDDPEWGRGLHVIISQ